MTEPVLRSDVGPVTISRGMLLMWRLDAELQRRFDPFTEEGMMVFFCWWLCFGGCAHPNVPFSATEEQMRFLRERAPLPTPEEAYSPSRLAVALWMGPDFFRDVYRAGGYDAHRVWGWYHAYGPEFLPDELLGPGFWDDMARPTPDYEPDSDPGLPRGLLAAWMARTDLQQEYRVDTSNGRRLLVSWWEEFGRVEIPLLADPRFQVHFPAFRENTTLAPERTTAPSTPSLQCGTTDPDGVNLVGFAFGELGIGEDVRMGAAALTTAHVPFVVRNVSGAVASRKGDRRLADVVAAGPRFHANIVYLPGMDFARLVLDEGCGLLRGRYTIGAWPWELPHWPEVLHDAFSTVQEIWASTTYLEQVFRETAPVEVFHMPMAVSLETEPIRCRQRFDFPEDCFVFLFVFDGLSGLHRKNPVAVMEAFRRAFPVTNHDVLLVIKCMNGIESQPVWQTMKTHLARDRRIRLINETLDRHDLLGLLASCDALVSLHRSEGFGRTLAEAMLLGKPVVCTDHSGNVDFTTPATAFVVQGPLVPVQEHEYPYAAGQYWCDPDVQQAAEFMKVCFFDSERASTVGRAGQRFVAANYNPTVVGQRYRQRLEELGIIRAP